MDAQFFDMNFYQWVSLIGTFLLSVVSVVGVYWKLKVEFTKTKTETEVKIKNIEALISNTREELKSHCADNTTEFHRFYDENKSDHRTIISSIGELNKDIKDLLLKK